MIVLYLNLTPDSKKTLANALARAMIHARRVSVREHIKADRFERVNQFITSLRREITTFGTKLSASAITSLTNELCNKSAWYDIGVPNRSNQILDECLRIAKIQEDKADIQSQEIEYNLELATSELHGIQHSIQEVNRINEESEVVVASLEKLFA
jgi:hypothetical protein